MTIASGKLRKKARHNFIGVYPSVRKLAYLARFPALRRSRNKRGSEAQ